MLRKKGKILLIILIFMMVFNFIYPTVYAGPISEIGKENANMGQNSSSSTGSTNSGLGTIVDWGVRNTFLSN